MGLLFLIPIAFADITIDPFERSEYNIGEDVNVKGSVVFNEAVVGAMKLDLYCDEESLPSYFTLLNLDVGEVYDFNLDIPTRETLIGKCNFLLTVDGAADDFEKSSNTFDVTTELDVDASADLLLANPGDTVVITGSAYKLNGEIVENGGASLLTEDDIILVELEDGLFSYNFNLFDDAKSGKHEVVFSVEDLNGNKGEDTVTFKVMAVPKSIELSVNDIYAPGDAINTGVLIYDQAGDLIDKDVVVEVYKPDGDLDYTQTVSTSGNFEVELDQFAVPGLWKISAKSDILDIEKTFLIGEVKSKEEWVEGTMLYVRNTGNVDYTDLIEIQLEGENEVTITKETSLKPNQTIEIDLNEEVSYAGEYSVKSSGNAITGNVVLEGKKFSGSSLLGWIAIMFVFLFFIYMVVSKGKKFVGRKKNIIGVREKGKNMLERTSTKDDEIKQKDIDYLVEKVKKEEPVKEEKKDSSDNSQNMFRIFD